MRARWQKIYYSCTPPKPSSSFCKPNGFIPNACKLAIAIWRTGQQQLTNTWANDYTCIADSVRLLTRSRRETQTWCKCRSCKAFTNKSGSIRLTQEAGGTQLVGIMWICKATGLAIDWCLTGQVLETGAIVGMRNHYDILTTKLRSMYGKVVSPRAQEQSKLDACYKMRLESLGHNKCWHDDSKPTCWHDDSYITCWRDDSDTQNADVTTAKPEQFKYWHHKSQSATQSGPPIQASGVKGQGSPGTNSGASVRNVLFWCTWTILFYVWQLHREVRMFTQCQSGDWINIGWFLHSKLMAKASCRNIVTLYNWQLNMEVAMFYDIA